MGLKNRKKNKDLMHPVTYKRENGKFDVNWYLKEDRKDWVLPKVLKEQAKNSGDERIILNVNKQNPSYYFYVSQGFKVYEEGVFEIGNGYVMDDYLMEFIVQ